MEKTKNKVAGNRSYVLQKEKGDRACTLIAFMNHVIHRDGKCPIVYRSKEFWKLCDDCDGGRTYGIGNKEPAFKKLKIKHWWFYYEVKDLADYRKLIKSELKRGRTVLFSVPNPDDSTHAVLIVDYSKEMDVFTVINAKYHTRHNPVEFLSWSELMLNFFDDDGNLRMVNDISTFQASVEGSMSLK